MIIPTRLWRTSRRRRDSSNEQLRRISCHHYKCVIQSLLNCDCRFEMGALALGDHVHDDGDEQALHSKGPTCAQRVWRLIRHPFLTIKEMKAGRARHRVRKRSEG